MTITYDVSGGNWNATYELIQNSIMEGRQPSDAFMSHLRRESLVGKATTTARFPIAPTAPAAALTDGVDMSLTAWTPTSTTITAAEVGSLLELTDLAATSSLIDIQRIGRAAGRGVATKIASDVLALGSGFSQSVGATTVDLTEAVFMSAITTLELQDVTGPLFGVLYPEQYSNLVSDIGTTLVQAANGVNPRAETNEWVNTLSDKGMLYSVHLYTSTDVPTANAGADSLGFIAQSGYTIGLVEKWATRGELQRDISMRANEVATTAAVGVGELEDASGVGILSGR
ncbi:MAG: hypothetical protein WC977_02430 [Anaerovoracaceae bacterium]|jgi:hypothetical protein